MSRRRPLRIVRRHAQRAAPPRQRLEEEDAHEGVENEGIALRGRAVCAGDRRRGGQDCQRHITDGNCVATPLVRATVGDDIKIIGDGNRIELRTKEATDVVLVHNVAQAGWTSGWHMHTGLVFISVVSGTATLYDSTCGGRVFTNGQAFVEPPMTPVNVKNETGARLEWYTTQLIPAGGATRLNIPSPC